MDRKFGGLIALLLLAPDYVGAQSTYESGRALGEMLTRNRARENAVYRDTYQQAIEAETARIEAENRRFDARMIEAENTARADLEAMWSALGLPQSEARNMAAAFRLAPEQLAINDRALRDGSQATTAAAITAYKNYQYLLANQLLIAAFRVHTAEPKAKGIAP
jgi:transcription initiation factor TFIIIB Brf1 subunit/transcription initiation factor TFIIB